MADLFASLSMASRALDAQRLGLDVVGQNLANVNTAGYSKRSLSLEAVPPLDQQSAGGGVRVTDVTAARDPLLDARLYRERPAAGREAAVAEQLGIVESAVGAPGTSLDARISEFLDGFAALADAPTSAVARQLVIVQGQSLTQAFHDMAASFAGIQRDADIDVRGVVEQINSLADTIASLNVAIGDAPAGSAATLRDQQGIALRSLANLVDIGVIPREGGGADVTMGNGMALVAGENAYALRSISAPPQQYAQIVSGTTDLTSAITAGRLGGLILSRDLLIEGYRQRLDDLAFTVASDVNALHAAGVDLNGAPGGAFFTQPAQADGAAAGLAIDPALAADPRLIAAGRVAAGDNLNARAIAALREGDPSPTDEWGVLVHRIGVDRRAARLELATREDVLGQLESLRSQISSVSIDEEAASMLRFQKAYEANARFFNVVNGLLDTLMSTVG